MATIFERELKSFKARLTHEEQSSFTGTTLDDLRLTVASIQKTQISDRTNRNVARLRTFLEAVESISKVLDLFVNISDFVAFVWGPIKYLLLVSMPGVSSRQRTFQLKALRKIGSVAGGRPAIRRSSRLSELHICDRNRPRQISAW